MFFTPMLIGAALGGGLSALRGGNPLVGGLLGGIGGGIFGGASQLAGAAAAPAAASGIAAQPALSMAGAQTAAGQAMASPSLLATMKQIPTALGQFTQQNPVLSNIGMQAAMSEFNQPQVPMAQPAGLMRGQMAQMPQQQYGFGAPQISLI